MTPSWLAFNLANRALMYAMTHRLLYSMITCYLFHLITVASQSIKALSRGLTSVNSDAAASMYLDVLSRSLCPVLSAVIASISYHWAFAEDYSIITRVAGTFPFDADVCYELFHCLNTALTTAEVAPLLATAITDVSLLHPDVAKLMGEQTAAANMVLSSVSLPPVTAPTSLLSLAQCAASGIIASGGHGIVSKALIAVRKFMLSSLSVHGGVVAMVPTIAVGCVLGLCQQRVPGCISVTKSVSEVLFALLGPRSQPAHKNGKCRLLAVCACLRSICSSRAVLQWPPLH